MSEPLYRSHAVIDAVGPLHRRAELPTGAHVEFGVHGPIQELFRLNPARPLPLPVDFVVAAAGG